MKTYILLCLCHCQVKPKRHWKLAESEVDATCCPPGILKRHTQQVTEREACNKQRRRKKQVEITNQKNRKRCAKVTEWHRQSPERQPLRSRSFLSSPNAAVKRAHALFGAHLSCSVIGEASFCLVCINVCLFSIWISFYILLTLK